jgi:diacylglycerol kinase (ATP)
MSADPEPRPEPRRPTKSKSLAESFRHAFDGMSHVLHSQRHVRYQLIIFAMVLAVSLAIRVTPLEFAALVLAMGLLLVAELVNTAVEAVVDLITDRYELLAKIAKDIAGAAVLVASMTAAVSVTAVFLQSQRLRELLDHGAQSPPPGWHVVLIAAGLLAVVVTLGKVYGGHGTLLRGGVISGHAALAFLLFGTIFYLSHGQPLISAIAFLAALLVALSRVNAGIHTVREVAIGALLAMLVIGVVFIVQAVGSGR